jgi:hypothetical protein
MLSLIRIRINTVHAVCRLRVHARSVSSKAKQNKTKQNQTKPNKTKQNKTKQNKTKKKLALIVYVQF